MTDEQHANRAVYRSLANKALDALNQLNMEDGSITDQLPSIDEMINELITLLANDAYDQLDQLEKEG